jgi:hypothetical protein
MCTPVRAARCHELRRNGTALTATSCTQLYAYDASQAVRVAS